MEFKYLDFKEREDSIRVFLYRIFYFDIPREEVLAVGNYKLKSHAIEFENKADNKFSLLISKYIPNLVNSINQKPSVYIHKNSGIPLIGNGAFGIVDRGTNLLEIKPVTGCNLDCVYCSINEPQKVVDFVVEPEYLVEELGKMCEHKKSKELEVHIGCQGEPLLYEPLADLIKGMREIPRIERISMDTNLCAITRKRVEELLDAGLTQFNISINSLDFEKARKIANAHYEISRIIRLTRYISKRCDVNIAPVLVPTINDEDMEEIARFVKDLQTSTRFRVRLAIQKFLHYKFGKRPVKEEPWDGFWMKLKKLERKYGLKLIFDASDFSIQKDDSLKKPFRKNDAVKTIVMCPGRIRGERIAVSQDRTISVANCSKDSGSVRVRILRDKHNIFFGKEV